MYWYPKLSLRILDNSSLIMMMWNDVTRNVFLYNVIDTFFVIDYSSLNSPFMLDRVLAFIICNLFGFHFETKLRTFQYMRLQYLGCHIFPLDTNLDWLFLRLVVKKHFIQVDVLRSFSLQPSTPRKRLLPYYIKSSYAIKR